MKHESLFLLRYLRLLYSAILMAILVLVPSVYDVSFIDITVLPKTLTLIAGLTIVFLTLAIAVLLRPDIKVRLSLKKIDLLLLAVVCLISINRYLIQSQYGFSIRYMELICLCIFYVMLRRTAWSTYYWLLLAIAISGIVQATHGIVQLLGYLAPLNVRFPITGSFLNPGPYAGFLAITWVVSLGCYLYKDRLSREVHTRDNQPSWLNYRSAHALFCYLPLLSMGLTLIVLPATESRAAWLAILIGTGILLIDKYKVLSEIASWTTSKKALLTVAILMIVSLSSIVVYHVKKDSADGRVLIWKTTLQMIKEDPWCGVGYDQFKAHYMNAQAAYFSLEGSEQEAMVAGTTRFAFNEALQLISENGLIVFMLVLIIYVFCFNLRVPEKQVFLKVFFIAVLLTIVGFGMFSYPSRILPIKMLMVFSLAALASLDQPLFRKVLVIERVNEVHFVKVSVLLVSLFIVWRVVEQTTELKRSFDLWQSAMQAHYRENVSDDKALAGFAQAFPILEREPSFLKAYGKVLISHGLRHEAIDLLERARKYQNLSDLEITLAYSLSIL